MSSEPLQNKEYNNDKPTTAHEEQSIVIDRDESSSSVELSSTVTNEIAIMDEHPTYLRCSGKKLQVLASLMCSTAFTLFGYDQGVMGSLILLPAFRKTFPKIDVIKHTDNHTSTMQGFTIAVYEIGCLLGALTNLQINDRYGRLKSILIGCALMIIGGAIQASSFSLGQFIAGRIISGIGNGLNTSSVPVYQSEIARPEIRGKLVMLSAALTTGGVALSYWLDFGMYFTKGEESFRFPIGFQIIFPIVILPLLFKLPDSPRWLASKGKFVEAAKVFAAFEGTSVNDEHIKHELRDIRISLLQEKSLKKESRFKSMFKQGKHRNFQRLMLGFWSQVFQQISGINLITYYAGTVFEKYIGMSPVTSRILAACNGTEYFMASFIAIFTIEHFGRRKLMIFGSFGQCLSMALLTVLTHFSEVKNDSSLGIGSAIMLFAFNTFFAIGWLGMSWLLPAELTPLSIRASANAISTAGNWAFNFLVVMITPVCFNSIGSYTYTIFAVINALIIPCVYFLYPETKGRSLEEMDYIFEQCPIDKPWEINKVEQKVLHVNDVESSIKPDYENIEYAMSSELTPLND